MEGIINPTKAFMLRKTLLAFLFIFMFASISLSYGQTSCEAPSCSALTITGPDKVSLGQSKSYTLTGGESKNIRWSVDNPNASITGNNSGATLTVGSACNCNNGAITITAKDTQTGCTGTFRVQAGTWVTIFDQQPFCCGGYGGSSCYKVDGLFQYDIISQCHAFGPDSCTNCYNSYIANGWPVPDATWRNSGGGPCEYCNSSNCPPPNYGCGACARVRQWKCPAPSQSCPVTCSLGIADFKTSAATFDPYYEPICLSGLIDELTGKPVEWKIEIKDDEGKVVKHFEGGAAYVAASWDGRDDNGDIVPDGIYKALLTAKTGDGKCTVRREIEVTVQSECRFTISIDPKEVWPQIPATQRPTGYMEDWTKATVLVTLLKPAPLGGCNIDFTVEPVENTGGHEHGGGRPKGTVEPANINIPSGTEGTVKVAAYTSNEIGGEEKIIAKMDGEEVAEKTIKVRVENLSTLSSGTAYRLTGQTEKHGSNHYGTNSTIVNTPKIANDFYAQFDATIGINDMSLIYGGLFDICGTYNPADTCSNAPNGGHSSHRKGTSVDIDRCAKSVISNNQYPQGDCTNGYIKVDKNEFKKICESHAGYLVREGTIHCEISR